MNPEIKTKWLEALRAGKYKQGYRQLRPDSEYFCCLGVLCDVVAPQGWQLEDVGYNYNGKRMLPSDGFLASCQIDKGIASHLAGMNDDDIKFPEIADWIESNV